MDDPGYVEFDMPHGMARAQSQFEGMNQRIRVTRAALLKIKRLEASEQTAEQLYDQNHLDVWMALPDPLPPHRDGGIVIVDHADVSA